MSFQPPTTTTAASTAFSFGLASAGGTAPSKPGSFSFGATGGGDAGTVKPLAFGAPTATTTSMAAPAAVGFGSGFLGATTTAAGTVAAPTVVSAPSTSFSLGAPTASSAAVAPTSAAATTTASTGFGFGALPAVTTTSSTATTTTSATAAPVFSLPIAKTTSAAPPTLGSISTSTAPATGGFANLSTATKTTDSAAAVNASHLSYNQLEDHINKWTLELEEQEKVFADQATQINAWDKILISNNHKILELNDAVQKVKSDQQTLEQELEFIATQHKELEESIVPLQKEFLKLPQVDVERSQTYLLVENLDTQLKQMSEDLKEIIDNLNEANKGQDSADPIIQIGKILNAHMSSLQWIESSTTNISNKLDDITKMHESFKRESERSFRSAYYN
ncbi:PREDICTED: nuclear pore glycoprotein p62 [Rhagoletis zephyria]|uniref:nuclear pore glycoprotein p62 n=1 Tax=Rhagoletis zephyria TaxID=28612 RepID=UPI00081140E2|nr:PREDICTED: nuclear pore glycoprotein p62 [Rhagoletis zephyria]